MESLPRWVFPAGLVAVVAVVAVLVAQLGGGSEDADEETTSDSVVSSSTVTIPTPTERSTPDVPDGSVPPDAATRTTLLVLRAYATYSYKDDGHKAWLHNLRPLVTDSVVHEMVELFGPDDYIYKQMWKDDIVAKKAEGRPAVDDVQVAAGDSGDWHYTYAFHLRQRTGGGAWTDVEQPRTVDMTVEKRNGSWVVSSLSESGL